MKYSMKFALILVSAVLANCASYEAYKREVASRPEYGSQYMPINGMNQEYPREAALEVCKAVSAGQSYETYLRTLSNSPQSAQSGPTTIRCRDSLGTVTCKAKPTIGANMYAQLQAQKYEANKTNSMLISMALAMRACMAKSGYSMQKVCVRNCNVYQSSSQSLKGRDLEYQRTLIELKELKEKNGEWPKKNIVTSRDVQAAIVSNQTGWIGIQATPVPSKSGLFNSSDSGVWLLVHGVFNGGPAHAANVHKGDLVTAINGKSFVSEKEASLLISNVTPGRLINLELLREGNIVSTVVLADSRSNFNAPHTPL